MPVEYGFSWISGGLNEIRRREKVLVEAGKSHQVFEILSHIAQENNWDVLAAPLFTKVILYVNDLDLVGQILTDRHSFHKSPMVYKMFTSIGGVRLLGKYGLLHDPGTEIWAKKRRVIDPAFHRNFLRTIMKKVNITADNLVHNFMEEGAEGDAFDITDAFEKASFSTISACGFDWSMDMIEKHGPTIREAIKDGLKVIQLGFSEPLTINLPFCRRAEKKALSKSVQNIRHIIKEHLEYQIANMGTEPNILSHMIEANQVSEVLNIENLVDEYITFLLAGMEGTAITLAIATFYLSVYPHVRARAQAEVKEVLGARKVVEFEDLTELRYLEMVIKETLRLKPPLRVSYRAVVRDGVYNKGRHLPNGCMLFIPTSVIQVDPRYWKDPLEFNPDRFAPSVKRMNYSFMPFSLGSRYCVGKNFSMVGMKVILARMIQTFDLVSPNPDIKDIEVIGKVTTRPKDGVKMILKARK